MVDLRGALLSMCLLGKESDDMLKRLTSIDDISDEVSDFFPDPPKMAYLDVQWPTFIRTNSMS